MRKYKKGDVVKVYSLQSFFGGGFLQGTEGIVSQDQYSESVLVAVPRNFGGDIKIDPSYEVYPEQLKLITKPSKSLTKTSKSDDILKQFSSFLNELKEN